MRLIVGLGNPGPKYERNRHNIGFMAVDEIVRRHDFSGWRARFQGHTAEGTLSGEKLVVLKPATFMNESGRAVGEALRFFKLDPSDVVVLYDELDLAPTKVKVKQGGGNGGHNGLRSLDAHLGTDYWRVRIGIGHPGHKSKVIGHVLGDFAKAEWPGFEELIDGIARRFDLLAAEKPSDFMSKLAMDLTPERSGPASEKSGKKKTAESEATTAHVMQTATTTDADASKPSTGLAAQLSQWLKKGS